MFGIDKGGRITFVTETLAARLSTTTAALTGRPLETVVTGDGAAALAAAEELAGAPAGRTRRCRLSFEWSPRRVTTVEFASTGDGAVVATPCESHGEGERFRRLFEGSTDAVVSFEMVGMVPVVRSVNAAFVATFGYGRAEVVGESLNDIIVPEEHAAEAENYDKQTAAGETNHDVVTRMTVDGRREFVYRGLSYTTDGGRRYGFAVYTDVTDDRRRQRRLRVLHRVLRHNLRNDLSVILGMAEYVRETATDPERDRVAGRILTAAERLTSVSERAHEVESALDSRSDRAVDAAEIARSVAASYRGDGIQLDVPATAPVGGGTALYDGVDNLVENAVVHTPDGTAVRVTIGEDHGETYVRVADDGPGIPATERAAVFEDEDITGLKHGSGLGLWLARWVAEAAGGECRYDRRDGWTTVTLWLPTADEVGELTPSDGSVELAD